MLSLDPARSRSRWKDIQEALAASDGDGQPQVRVALLASYTIDPLIPHLGVPLADGGCLPVLRPGSFNQIVQECLDDDSGTARFEPDVLVVSPLLDELRAPDLAEIVDVVTLAARRWHSTLVMVLPPVPDGVLRVIGDSNDLAGATAAAYAARERARERILGTSDAYVIDLEAVLRTVGTSHAHHPGLWNYAKIPFTEEVFARLGAAIGRVLRLRMGESCTAAVLDLPGLATTVADAERIAPIMRRLKADGIQVYLRGDQAAAQLWGQLAGAGSEVVALADDWTFGAGAADEQAAALVARAAPPGTQATLITTDPAATLDLSGGAVRVVRLGSDSDRWWADVIQASVFDRLPVPRAISRDAAIPAPAPLAREELSLDAFIAGLRVEVDFRRATAADTAKVSEMMLRTKDFTLGTSLEREHLEAALADEDRDLHVGLVHDRLGDYGLSTVVAFRIEGVTCVVDAMLISCPTMGRGVEDKALKYLIELAVGRGCEHIILNYIPTGRNQVALEFFREATSRKWLVPGHLTPTMELSRVGAER